MGQSSGMQHSMFCEYPEGCSCGATLANALDAKVTQLIKEKDEANRQRQRAEEIVCAVIDAMPLQDGKDLAASIRQLVAERDKLLGFYTEIVRELGDDLVVKRIRDLTKERDDAVQLKNDAMVHLTPILEISDNLGDLNEKLDAALDITLAALDDIHISAHCIAKAGPFGTPTLDKAWPQFMELAVKATNAIYQARQAREGTS